jgi:hypothetical protein
LGIGHLGGMKNPLEETFTEFVERVLDAVDFNQIHA